MLKIYATKTYLDEVKEIVDSEFIERITEDDKVITEMNKETGMIDYSPIKDRIGEDVIYVDEGVEKEATLLNVIAKEKTKDGIAKIVISFN